MWVVAERLLPPSFLQKNKVEWPGFVRDGTQKIQHVLFCFPLFSAVFLRNYTLPSQNVSFHMASRPPPHLQLEQYLSCQLRCPCAFYAPCHHWLYCRCPLTLSTNSLPSRFRTGSRQNATETVSWFNEACSFVTDFMND